MRFSKTVQCACAAGALLLAAAPAAQAARIGIILFKKDYFSGDSRALGVHEDAPDLGWMHFDDRISSLQVRRGVWELCTNDHFRGRCITVDHDVAKLGRLGMDDQISSVRRVR
jgi:hypothetical protein